MKLARGKRRTLCVLVVASAFGILSASSAAAKSVTVGQLSTPSESCVAATLLQPGAAGTSYTVPKAGVITSWSFQDAGTINPGLKLKVARPTGTADTYKIVGEDTAGTQTPNTVNTYPAHIPVRAGNFLGIYQGVARFAEPTRATPRTCSLATLASTCCRARQRRSIILTVPRSLSRPRLRSTVSCRISRARP